MDSHIGIIGIVGVVGIITTGIDRNDLISEATASTVEPIADAASHAGVVNASTTIFGDGQNSKFIMIA